MKKQILATLGTAGLVVAAMTAAGIWSRRVELFVIPHTWREIQELRQDVERNPKRKALRDELYEHILKLVKLQRPEMIPDDMSTWFALVPLRGLDGRHREVLMYTDPSARRPRWYALENIWGTDRVVLVDANGFLTGEIFQVPPVGSRMWRRRHESSATYGILGVQDSSDTFEITVDHQGIVPLGFTRAGGAVSSGSDVRVHQWRTADKTPRPSIESLDALLASKHPGNLFRALHLIERLGGETARRALAITDHPIARLRARAVAVAANDPSLGSELAKFLDDHVEAVRHAAALALVDDENQEIAQRALLYLVRWRHKLPLVSVDLARLSSSEIAEVLVRRCESTQINAIDDDLIACFAALGSEHLAPMRDRLLVLLRRSPDDRGGRCPLRDALIRSFVSFDDSDSRLQVAAFLKGNVEDQHLTLSLLLDRDSPVAELIPPLRKVACNRGLGLPPEVTLTAALTLVAWDVPSALQELLAGLQDPERDWLYEPVYRSRPEFVRRELDRHAQSTLVVSDEVGLLEEFARPEVVATLFEVMASLGPGAQDAFEVLKNLYDDQLAAAAPALAASWSRFPDHPSAWVPMIDVLIGAAHPELDAILVGVLERDRRPLLPSALLNALLVAGRRIQGNRAVSALESISNATLTVSQDVIDDREWWRESYPGQLINNPVYAIIGGAAPFELDCALAASILLVRWETPGAAERLAERLRQPGNTWLFDSIAAYVPQSFDRHLRALAREQPERYAERVEQLIGGRDSDGDQRE